jgi:hypothetical protein
MYQGASPYTKFNKRYCRRCGLWYKPEQWYLFKDHSRCGDCGNKLCVTPHNRAPSGKDYRTEKVYY